VDLLKKSISSVAKEKISFILDQYREKVHLVIDFQGIQFLMTLIFYQKKRVSLYLDF